MTDKQIAAYANARIAFGHLPGIRLRTEDHITTAYEEAKPWRYARFVTDRINREMVEFLWPTASRAGDLTEMGRRVALQAEREILSKSPFGV